MRNLKIVPALTLGLMASMAVSCQSMSEGIFAVEGRALIFEDTSIDETRSVDVDSSDFDTKAYGVQAAFMTPILDIVGGVDWREYGDEDATELNIGLRRRIFEIGIVHPYVEGNLRYGLDFEHDVDEEDYFGWNLGVGTLVDITDNLFANVRVMYETFDLDDADGDPTIDGVIATVGLGLSF